MAIPDKPVHGRTAMIANMRPVLHHQGYVFCFTTDPAVFQMACADCLAFFREDEGFTLVLPVEVAPAHGFATDLPMARIVLEVYSALDGVGLTAAVATALADENIPCNMVSAYHHDHVFVPELQKHEALRILSALQAQATGEA